MSAAEDGYTYLSFLRGSGTGIYMEGGNEKVIAVRHNLPGAVILVHGVNDVGNSYEAVEKGLCAGLTERLRGDLRPATYSNPQPGDENKLEDDPDARYFKRTLLKDTHSPVIPFYWGYRETQALALAGSKTPHGQATDRYGNRLDKDFSKGGGTFANATSSLPEMWKRGKSKAWGLLDYLQRDATHPVLDNPGRLYMILAARRLAALIAMIRDYDRDETVSIVAHSQGCMISLLAQAFLLETGEKALQANARPADTLILCNPPYSLIDPPRPVQAIEYYSGSDAAMAGRYDAFDGRQTLHARLSTLSNIVTGVQKRRHATPPLSELTDVRKYRAVVGAKWLASEDRDNRGKVYLYFSPEDMTVALENVQGIGWQGVPDLLRGTEVKARSFPLLDADGNPLGVDGSLTKEGDIIRRPLAELGKGFFQRVFTLKRRPDFHNGQLVLIGQKAPHDFALRGKGEDDQAHTDVSDSLVSKHIVRANLDAPGHAPFNASDEERARFGQRRITGEPLPKPVFASMGEGASTDAKGRFGASEQVDPIGAAIAVTSDYGIDQRWEVIGEPRYGHIVRPSGTPITSPKLDLFTGMVIDCPDQRFSVEQALNENKPPEERCEVLRLFVCMDVGLVPRPLHPIQFLIQRTERASEARKRWQHARTARSFHDAIFGGSKNHQYVTAYDVAIGEGTATTHPFFYRYLCAVADWRLKDAPVKELRPGIVGWDDFRAEFKVYWDSEPPWRKAVIHGNVDYYTKGKLPDCLPLPPEGFPSTVVDQSFRVNFPASKEGMR